jgi:hypothetical protein
VAFYHSLSTDSTKGWLWVLDLGDLSILRVCVFACVRVHLFFVFLELSTFWTQCLETRDACVYFSYPSLPLHLMKVLRLNLIKHEEFHE